MIPTKAIAAFSPTTELGPYEFERREPKEHDVVIDIKYCGICHSDIHTIRDEWSGSNYPIVPGHEIAGVVRAVGQNVTKYKVGDHVGVGCFVDSCRTCANCKNGNDQYCLEGVTVTYNGFERDGKTKTQGGYAQVIVVNEDYVLNIPKSLPLDKAAPLMCAGITLYSPLAHWKVGPGKKVAILGLGGLGHMGVKIAVALGADVTVLSHTANKKEAALKLGAQHFICTSDPSVFKAYANHFDLIVNTVSHDIDLKPYLESLVTDGTLVSVGAPARPYKISAFSLLLQRRSLAGSCIGSIKETQEMLDFCAEHNVTPEIEVISPGYVNEACERVLKSDVRYRFVIDISKL